MKKLISYLIIFFQSVTVNGQTDMDRVLKEVEVNNKSIQANQKYWEARREEFKAGLTPNDPQIEYDYLFGSPAGAGNQKDLSITQRLDFPTVYKKKRELAGQQIAQTEIQKQVHRQDVLLQAKLIALQIIYLNKRSAELSRRLARTKELVQDYEKKLDKGEVIVLEVNKAKLQLLNITNETALNNNEILGATTKLTELNGGLPLFIRDTTYPDIPGMPDFETLDSIIEAGSGSKIIKPSKVGSRISLTRYLRSEL
jgi:outer membrane protein TolC